MDMKASAPRGKHSFLEHCEKLNLKATRPGEAEFFAALASAFYSGGKITVARPGKEPVEIEFGE